MGRADEMGKCGCMNVARARALLSDKKPLTKITGAFNSLFERAEDAGLFPRSPSFIRQYHDDYPGLAALEANHADVRRECEALVRVRHNLVDVERMAGKYTSGGIHAINWKSFMFKSGSFILENCRLAPRTAALLREVRGLYTAFFSVLEGNQYITPHWG